MKSIRIIIVAMIAILTAGLNAQEVKVDVVKSTLKWEGKKVGGAHDGYIKLKKGQLSISGDKIVSGLFVIDMTTITNEDIESKEYKDKLVGHLKSDDFFGVEKYPTSTLKVNSSTKFVDNKAKVVGELTIKGKSNPIEFDVVRKGKVYTAILTVDRSKYNVRYGSKSFFDNLGDKVIYDEFTLEVSLVSL
ncbi:YceI family protein [Plebeiibacterium marinum]|uniref:YceI family protein n=1 Tax=Plebeiibacterium marinum TaxID=2992111 RepID=A0AAE3MEK3_9BACT|nr:YceI family protein [Plebeiobacterium marinum]MCW3806011.1 YceI family protein [Plebeiobacterium marinum]